jgi:hypothetical protein
MAIYIYLFFGFLALVAKLKSEPILCSWLCDYGMDFKSRENNCVDMLTEDLRGYSAKCLRYEICVHIVQDQFIIE